MRGQGMVEFALMLPIVLLMIYGLMEMARLMQAYLTIQHAAREGARYAVTGQSTTGVVADRPSSIVAKTRDAAAGLQIASSSDTPNVEPGSNPFYLDVSLDPVNGGGATSLITVTVTYNYAPLMPVRLGDITLLPTVVKLQGRAVMITERIDKVTPIAQTGNVAGALYNISGNIFGVANVTVSITSGGTGAATTDSNGNYSLASLANGTYTITPTKTGCTFSPATLTVTLNGAHSTGNNFTSSCSPGGTTYSIGGTVTGATGVTLTLNGSTQITTDSTYTFSGLSSGSYTVAPSKSGCTFNPTSRSNISLPPDSSGNDFTASCSGGTTYSINGTVTLTSGTTLTLTLNGATVGTTTTDSTYIFSGLSDTSTYVITPSKTGCTFTPTTWTVTIPGANVSQKDFTCNYTISGNVQTSGGANMSGVTMTLSNGSTTTTNSSGNYSFSGLPGNGTYTVTPTYTGYTFSPSTSSTLSISSPTQNFVGTASGCAITGTAITISSDKASLNITNGGGSSVSISNIVISWPSSNTKLKEVKFKTSSNEKIWDAGDTASPTDMPTDGGWKSGGDRTLGAGSTKTLEFKFEDNAASTGYTITVTFDNGCSVSKTK